MSVDFYGGKKDGNRMTFVGERTDEGIKPNLNLNNRNGRILLELLGFKCEDDMYGDLEIEAFMSRMDNARSTLVRKAEARETVTGYSTGRLGCRVIISGIGADDIVDRFERLQGLVDEAFALGATHIMWS